MARKQRLTLIEEREDREEIDKAIVDQVPIREIAQRFDVSEKTVYRYIGSRFAQKAATAIVHRDLSDGESIVNRLLEFHEDIETMFRSITEWLRDADDPSKFNIGPRAEEVTVQYMDLSGGTAVKKKALLSELIDRNLKKDEWKTGVSVTGVDNRKLLLETSDRLTKQLELVAKIYGQLKEVHVNVFQTQIHQEVQALIMDITHDMPEVKEKLATRLWELAESQEAGVSA